MTQPFIDILGLTQGTPKASDNYPAVDVTDPAQSPSGTTKRYILADLFNFIISQFGFLTLPAAIAASTGPLNATYDNMGSGINATLTDASGTFLPFVLDNVVGIVGSVPYLIKNQVNPVQNGIYFLQQNGNGVSVPWKLIRVFYFNSSSNIIDKSIITVTQGTVNAGTTWQVSVAMPVTVGTTSIFFNAFNITPVSMPWIDVTSNSVTMDPNTGYIADNNVSRVNATLPVTCARGGIIRITGLGTQGWIILQNAGQSINFGALSTTVGVGGSLASIVYDDAVELVCVVSNTKFNVLSVQGNLTVV